MATNNYSGPEFFCLWPSEAMLKTLPVRKPWEPVLTPENEQRIDDSTGLPLWKNSVKIRAGWNGDLSTIFLRFAAENPPLFTQLSALEIFLAQGHTKAELANLLSLAEAEEVNK